MQNHKNNKAQLYASYLTAVSLFALAGAIVYFTVGMVKITQQIPDILLTVENTSKEIEPIVSEISAIQKQIPLILKETENTRKLVEQVLVQYTKTNNQIPRILDEVEATRKVLPDAFKTADNASKAVLVISKEIKITRESIPATMDRADKLIANAREAGQQASSGAVSGIFTGILMAPFDFVGSVSDTLIGDDEVSKKLSDKDNEDIEKATSEILTAGNVGDKNAWSNKDSGNSGLIELVDISDDDDGDECREIQIVIKHKGDEIQNKNTTLCNQDGKWDLK